MSRPTGLLRIGVSTKSPAQEKGPLGRGGLFSYLLVVRYSDRVMNLQSKLASHLQFCFA